MKSELISSIFIQCSQVITTITILLTITSSFSPRQASAEINVERLSTGNCSVSFSGHLKNSQIKKATKAYNELGCKKHKVILSNIRGQDQKFIKTLYQSKLTKNTIINLSVYGVCTSICIPLYYIYNSEVDATQLDCRTIFVIKDPNRQRYSFDYEKIRQPYYVQNLIPSALRSKIKNKYVEALIFNAEQMYDKGYTNVKCNEWYNQVSKQNIIETLSEFNMNSEAIGNIITNISFSTRALNTYCGNLNSLDLILMHSEWRLNSEKSKLILQNDLAMDTEAFENYIECWQDQLNRIMRSLSLDNFSATANAYVSNINGITQYDHKWDDFLDFIPGQESPFIDRLLWPHTPFTSLYLLSAHGIDGVEVEILYHWSGKKRGSLYFPFEGWQASKS